MGDSDNSSSEYSFCSGCACPRIMDELDVHTREANRITTEGEEFGIFRLSGIHARPPV